MAISILIVDDHPSFRAVARRLLEAEGYDVVGEAADGAAGIAAVRERCPDVVLLDVHLPDSNGFDVAAELTKAVPSAAVVLVSSHESSDFGPLVSRSGARGFVSKSDLSGAAVSALVS